MKYVILLIIFFILVIFLIVNINLKDNDRNHYSLQNYKILNDISILLSNCSISSVKKYNISSHNDYIKYINYLSCKCKGIGYWGGFCLKRGNYYVGGNQVHDTDLTNELANMFKNKTVVDLGAGLGWYCPIISQKSKKCDQYDGSVNIEDITKGKVKYLNLAEPIKFECNYDIVISLEVAEHIPNKFEDIYVNNLVKCSREGILITWSKIGQGGHYHVNNKNKEDVIKLFEGKGLKYEKEISKRLKIIAKISWLKNNILYFTKLNV